VKVAGVAVKGISFTRNSGDQTGSCNHEHIHCWFCLLFRLPVWSPLFLVKLMPFTATPATFTNKHGLEQEVQDLKELAMVVVSQHIISLENVKLKLNLITDMVLTVMVMVRHMDMEDTDMPVMDTTVIILERDLLNHTTDTHMPMDSILMAFFIP
jgi:hypothetical protein